MSVIISARASCKTLRWDKVNTIRRVCIVQNVVLYSRLIWLNGFITLIRTETKRYDIVRFSKVATKDFGLGNRLLGVKYFGRDQKLQVNFDSGQNCTSGNKIKCKRKVKRCLSANRLSFPCYLMVCRHLNKGEVWAGSKQLYIT